VVPGLFATGFRKLLSCFDYLCCKSFTEL